MSHFVTKIRIFGGPPLPFFIYVNKNSILMDDSFQIESKIIDFLNHSGMTLDKYKVYGDVN